MRKLSLGFGVSEVLHSLREKILDSLEISIWQMLFFLLEYKWGASLWVPGTWLADSSSAPDWLIEVSNKEPSWVSKLISASLLYARSLSSDSEDDDEEEYV